MKPALALLLLALLLVAFTISVMAALLHGDGWWVLVVASGAGVIEVGRGALM